MNKTMSQHPMPIRAVEAALAALAAVCMAAAPAVAATTTPAGSAASAPVPLTPPPSTPKKPAPSSLPRVDINSASRAELKTLPGIGNAEADKIIAHRPYLTKTELVSKGVLGTGPYVSLKDRVIAVQKGPLPAPKP